MLVSDGPALVLSAADCQRLRGPLADAVRLGWLAHYARPPHALLALADAVARCAEDYHPAPLTSTSGGRTPPRALTAAPSGQDMLSTDQAAQRLRKSAGYLRALAREGTVTAVRGPGGGWRFAAADLDAYEAHRQEQQGKAA